MEDSGVRAAATPVAKSSGAEVASSTDAAAELADAMVKGRTSAHPSEEADAADTEEKGEEASSRHWAPSTISDNDLLELEKEGILPPKELCRWRSAFGHPIPAPKGDERVMLTSHLLRGLSLPPSKFFLSVLDYYSLQPHTIGRNNIL